MKFVCSNRSLCLLTRLLLTPLLLLAGLLTGCQSLSHPDQYPLWYGAVERPQLVVGYGAGRSREEANTQAQWDISQAISLDIDGQMTQQIETQTNAQARQANRKSIQRMKTHSQHQLTGLKTLHYETNNGWHYVALGYQNSGFIASLKQLDRAPNCDPPTDLGYLRHTALARRVEATLGCWPVFSLEHRHGRWYGMTAQQSYPLAEGDFAGLFSDRQHQALSLHTSASLLTEASLYSLSVTTREAGELSLIQLAANGSSMVLFSQKPVNRGYSVIYPPVSQYAGIQAIKVTPQAQEKLLTLAVLCPAGLGFGWLPGINEQTTIYSNPGHLPGLLTQIKQCKASAIVQTITLT